MSLIEKQSERKCKALRYLVDEKVYSPAYALEKLENLFDNEKVLEADYEELAEYLEELMDAPSVEETEEEIIVEPEQEETEIEEEGE
jgi:hypothetical protein